MTQQSPSRVTRHTFLPPDSLPDPRSLLKSSPCHRATFNFPRREFYRLVSKNAVRMTADFPVVLSARK